MSTNVSPSAEQPRALPCSHAGGPWSERYRADEARTDGLHRLLGHGLVDRRTYAEAPPRVEYGLTALGRSLVDGPMAALARWTTDHGDELLDRATD